MSEPTLRWPGQQESPVSVAPEPVATVVGPGEVQTLHAFGDVIHVYLGGAETGGQYTVFLDVTPPGGGPPPHYHDHEDEWFIPLEGQVEFFLDGRWQGVELHSVVFAPRGTVHTFRNSGDTPLKMLTHTAPAGFEIFFERCAAEFAQDGPPDMGRIVAIAEEHGIHFVTD